ncbi:response regulator [Mucilaginibacter antarcticus]|uniref:Response regulator n=1 Tax=Mucilaginibacter antarcticus TaxID=1855725 RepID=A0ABW5XTJ4_9SPHI
MINIILAEDHHIVRDGLRLLFQGEAEFNIVAEAKNGAEVLELLINGLQADVLITDINMPLLGGIELTDAIQEQYPALKTIILSALDNEKYVIKSFKAGASGYILKSVTAEELKFAVKHVFNGNQYICSEIASRFLSRLIMMPEPGKMHDLEDVAFSDRDIEVLSLLAAGMTNQEIADRLFASKRTIEGYRENMITRTGMRNTVALIHFAVSHGIIN